MTEAYRIGFGTHDSYGEGTCLLELVDYLDRRRHGAVDSETKLSDSPACVSPVIAEFGRIWSDGIGNGNEADEIRTRLLLPLAPLMLDTATTDEDEVTRAWLATDWLVRIAIPAFLELARLREHAERLRTLDPFTNAEEASRQRAALDAALNDARNASAIAEKDAAMAGIDNDAMVAAWSATANATSQQAAMNAAWCAAMAGEPYDAAGNANMEVAWCAAMAGEPYDAAGNANMEVAWCAAMAGEPYDAAGNANMDVACSDAWLTVSDAAINAACGVAINEAWCVMIGADCGALAPTVAELQASAVELVKAMCAVGREKGLNQ